EHVIVVAHDHGVRPGLVEPVLELGTGRALAVEPLQALPGDQQRGVVGEPLHDRVDRVVVAVAAVVGDHRHPLGIPDRRAAGPARAAGGLRSAGRRDVGLDLGHRRAWFGAGITVAVAGLVAALVELVVGAAAGTRER